MKTAERLLLAAHVPVSGQVLNEYVLILGLVLLVCFVVVGALGVQVSNLLGLVLPAFSL